MRFIDASVIVAILKPESDANKFVRKLEQDRGPFFISPLVRYEGIMSLARARMGPGMRTPTRAMVLKARDALASFTEELNATEIEITPEIGEITIDAAATYGKAVGHRAGLNFGDCYAYACAKANKLKLIYKGDDFGHTDLG